MTYNVEIAILKVVPIVRDSLNIDGCNFMLIRWLSFSEYSSDWVVLLESQAWFFQKMRHSGLFPLRVTYLMFLQLLIKNFAAYVRF